MANNQKLTYTQQGYDILKEELNNRITVQREKIKNDIAVARSFGDLSENAEYTEAREAQSKNETRIQELEFLIENAIVQDESTVNKEVVNLGSTVKVLIEGINKEEVYEIVSSNEAKPAEKKISDQSKIGSSLINHRVGDEVYVTVPNGSEVKMHILEISRK